MNDPSIFRTSGGVTAPQGFTAAGVRCGLKSGSEDLAVIYTALPATAAALFTRNRICAAPIVISRKHLRHKEFHAIVVNAGNANACTGHQGLKDALEMTELTAHCLGLRPREVLVASTGIIGRKMDMDKIRQGIKEACKVLSSEGNESCSRAILTTDLQPKTAARMFYLGKKEIPAIIGGIAKGSGMIHPNMATMLAFLTTDVNIEHKCLNKALKIAVDKTFNMITVDGDTSTNDSVFILANGKAGTPLIEDKKTEEFEIFSTALGEVCLDLARQIAADGEGATCLVRVEVEGALSKRDAKAVAKSIASSNLVKTAIFGRDPNWGRILCAVGYSGAKINPDKVSLWIGSEQVVERGCPLHDFNRETASAALKEKEVLIRVSLGQGKSTATAYTCDLTYDYIRINAEYHT